MARVEYREQESIQFPNIVVDARFIDNVHRGWRLTPAPGYYLYNSKLDELVTDMDTGVVSVLQSGFSAVYICSSDDPKAWTWRAVTEADIPDIQIF